MKVEMVSGGGDFNLSIDDITDKGLYPRGGLFEDSQGNILIVTSDNKPICFLFKTDSSYPCLECTIKKCSQPDFRVYQGKVILSN